MAGLRRRPVNRALLGLALMTACLGLSSPAGAQGSGGMGGMPSDYPVPATAREAYSPIGEGFEAPIEPRERLKGPRPFVDDRSARLKADPERQKAAPFFRDTDLKVNSRSYWFDEDSFGYDEPRALTTGGSVSYQSGFAADFLQLRSVLYTTQPLYAPQDAGDTLNVSPQGDQITTLGQLNARAKFAGQELTVGRELVRTPYINPYDSRMIPLTFEGVVLLPERNGEQPLDYIAAYLSDYKPRNTDKFIPFSEPLGVTQDEGVLINGIRYRTANWNYGLVNYWIKDIMNTAYGEIDYMLPFGGDGGPSFRVSVNDLDQRSVGEDLIPGGAFETYQASARLVASYRNFVLTGAVSQVGDGADIQKPFGFSPEYTAMMIRTFDSAGERAYLVSLSYDFARLGLEGVTFYVGWGKGGDAIDPDTGAPQPGEDELDLRLIYEPHYGRLEGLRVELGYIDWRMFNPELPSENLPQLRTIVNYVVPLL